MSKTILTIGATGMLGVPVTRHLCESGYRVRALVRDRTKALSLVGGEVGLVTGDVTDIASLRNAMSDCFAVHINLSGKIQQTGVENSVAAA
ncbi:MAG: NAD(P)H-binding protein [Desulfofustis sp. PB-SRB1]|jgi:uncharacterized protein YbjT (DUF2867 family)|nr:NAD(P)H-binding protein [Desulfofustis sp. PB-SRB1]MBM1002357.1 NAD(P)H-binding protein [Desulfofustis sp. PB-SRB1]HBH30278.1 hypothetical protein [Desulfofustis sp.]HBH31266.1 hypothetical protein [Desulfofustis sp.]